jgi:hypothetical protein
VKPDLGGGKSRGHYLRGRSGPQKCQISIESRSRGRFNLIRGEELAVRCN